MYLKDFKFILFIPGEPDVPENVLPVHISHFNNSCAVHVIWSSNVDRDKRSLTCYSVYRNDELMTSDAVYINNTWMSSLFNVPCGSHNISVDANNSCGRSIMSSNFLLSSEILHNLTVNVSTAECVATANPIVATNPPPELSCKSVIKYTAVSCVASHVNRFTLVNTCILFLYMWGQDSSHIYRCIIILCTIAAYTNIWRAWIQISVTPSSDFINQPCSSSRE